MEQLSEFYRIPKSAKFVFQMEMMIYVDGCLFPPPGRLESWLNLSSVPTDYRLVTDSDSHRNPQGGAPPLRERHIWKRLEHLAICLPDHRNISVWGLVAACRDFVTGFTPQYIHAPFSRYNDSPFWVYKDGVLETKDMTFITNVFSAHFFVIVAAMRRTQDSSTMHRELEKLSLYGLYPLELETWMKSLYEFVVDYCPRHKSLLTDILKSNVSAAIKALLESDVWIEETCLSTKHHSKTVDLRRLSSEDIERGGQKLKAIISPQILMLIESRKRNRERENNMRPPVAL